MQGVSTQKKYSAVERGPWEGATLNWGGLRRNGWLTLGLPWQSPLFFSPLTLCLFLILGLIVGWCVSVCVCVCVRLWWSWEDVIWLMDSVSYLKLLHSSRVKRFPVHMLHYGHQRGANRMNFQSDFLLCCWHIKVFYSHCKYCTMLLDIIWLPTGQHLSYRSRQMNPSVFAYSYREACQERTQEQWFKEPAYSSDKYELSILWLPEL